VGQERGRRGSNREEKSRRSRGLSRAKGEFSFFLFRFGRSQRWFCDIPWKVLFCFGVAGSAYFLFIEKRACLF
jgi:hypothetical protein